MARSSSVHYSSQTKPIIKRLQALAYRHSMWQVFSDFLLCFAVSISNSMDPVHYEEREKQYMDTIQKYTPEEVRQISEACGELVMAMEQCVQEEHLPDLLGRMFHELELHNKWVGQFFTPMPVADMMAQIITGPDDPGIRENGYASLMEPACGSGVMMLAYANDLRQQGYNYCQQMVVCATDVDMKCVHMCYIQLALYGIPAVVTHGNSLTMEEWSRWYTPAYLVDHWIWREPFTVTQFAAEDTEKMKLTLYPDYAQLRMVEALIRGDKDTATVTDTVDTVTKFSENVGEQVETVIETPEINADLQESEHGQFSLF